MNNAIDNVGTGGRKGGRPATEKLYMSLPYILGIYIFLNPFPATSPKEILFYTAALAFIVLVFTPGRQMIFRNLLFLLWRFWLFIILLSVRSVVTQFLRLPRPQGTS